MLTWRFQSIDPATGRPTDDPVAGFLPPNRTPPEGQGSVFFIVNTKPRLATGAEVRNRARIIFDRNEPIDTPEYLNTIDATPPTSQVTSATSARRSANFQVGWTGSDTGAGIAAYTVFVSENGAPYTVYIDNTTATSSAFVGRAGSTYSFYSIATDGAGNREVKTPTAERTIRVPKGRAFTRLRTP